MPITIKDVARIANVSPSTVSRVIADNPKISQQTKDIVLAAMAELNYSPNIIARSLANNKSYTLGLILPNNNEELFDNPFFTQIMKGISMYATGKGYFILYSYCKNEKEELKIIDQLVHGKLVDGIILTSMRVEDHSVEFLQHHQRPFVVIGSPTQRYSDILWVDNDNVTAMHHVVKRLVAEGHRKIAFIGGYADFTFISQRLEGYRIGLEEAGIPFTEAFVRFGEPNEKVASNLAKDILSTHQVDAFVCTDDNVAFGTLNAVRELGLNSAIVGFNNSPLSMYKSPSLSSVDINAEKIGYYTAKLLIDHIDGRNTELNHYVVGTHFIERESTKVATYLTKN